MTSADNKILLKNLKKNHKGVVIPPWSPEGHS